MTVRTRVAPSPTGDPHVGTAYVALFNYCLAKKHGGEFILRIEDTDQVRSTQESEQKIMEALKWLGLQWDEGPDVGGPHGPYRQSERSELYTRYVDELLEKGHAFRCFHTREELSAMRAERREKGEFPGYKDSIYVDMDPTESKELADSGKPFVVRMKVPQSGKCVIDDHFRGEIEIDFSEVDCQVLMKSDGLPTYHLANVVDDHLMGITHVLRGEEWISSAPKHLLLYEYFGWEAPKLAHLPLLRNPDKSKLSKRKNPTSILFYERMGYLPEGLLNYLGMMAFSMPDGEEKFTLEQMVENFDLDRVSMGAPVFDVDKLDWLNGRYLREDLDAEAFAAKVREWALNEDYLMPLVPLVQQRVDKLSDLGSLVAFFFQGLHHLPAEALETKKLDTKQTLKALQWTVWRLDALQQWDADTIGDLLRETADLLELKFRDYIKPFFIAISGQSSSTPLFDTMAILGPDLSRARLRDAIESLGGVSNKKQKKWEKQLGQALAQEGGDDEDDED